MANPAFQSELIFQGEDTKKCLGLRHGDADPASLEIISRGDGEGFSQGKNKLAVQAETGERGRQHNILVPQSLPLNIKQVFPNRRPHTS